ncbi:MAG: gliding motility-associated C-terminal domain-containing protein, partial [Mameliella sp.]|nr:gliding motility-associated C-terminal domain-containing protein [Phaeodactylibacter sp.]
VGTSVIIGGISFNENNQMGTYFVEDDDTGCDQAETVIVDLLPVVRDSVVFDLCEGESVVYEGVTYDEANPSSSDIFPNYTASGCDSIFEVICHFRPNPTYVVNETLCPGEALTVNGTTFDESQPEGTMTLEGAGSNGCDSIIQVALDFHPPALANLQSTLCAGSSITVNGTVYSESNPNGTEIIPGAAPNGCDSVYQIDLDFYDAFITELEESICAGESYTLGNSTYAQTGNYVDTLIALQGGCDSIVQLNLTVLPNASGGSSVSVCESSLPYNWNGQSLSSSGTYIAELTASNGCDSTATLQLQVIPAIPTPSGLSSYVICEGESLPQLSVQPLAGLIINWYDAPTGGNLLALDSSVFTPSSTGSYYVSAVAEGIGCESAERLAIEVEEQPAYFIQTPPVFTCTPSEAGMDTTYLISDSGCDSIVATQYILLPTPPPTEISITTCDEDLVGTDTLFLSTIFGCDSLVIRDISYQELDTTVINAVTCDTESAGTFYFNFISVEGCDSIVQLNQSFDTTFTSFATIETCDESLLGLDTIPLTTPSGCDSLAITEYIPAPVPQTAVDTLLCEGDELIFNGQTLSSEGIYYDTLQTAEGCDSIIELELILLSPPEPTLIEDVLCEGTIYIIGDTTLTEPGMYDLVLTSEAGCDSMVMLVLESISAPKLSAVPDSYLYPQEEAGIPINLVSNDTINGSGAWLIELLDLPAQGTVSVDSFGVGDYMLTNSEFTGIDSFLYEICPLDCPDSCSVAAVYVNILEDCEEAIVAEIPNAFTPDGDGINDYYDPLSDVSSNCLQNPQEAGMVIVNRWGEIVYEAEEYAPWDGRSMNNGKVVPQGYYHCILTFRFEEERVVRTPVHVLITR